MARTSRNWRTICLPWTILAVVILCSSCVSVSASAHQAVDTSAGAALPDTNTKAWVPPSLRTKGQPESLPPISAALAALTPPSQFGMPVLESPLDHRIPRLQQRSADSSSAQEWSIPVPGVANDIALPLKALQSLAVVNSSTMLCNGRSDICDLRYNQVASPGCLVYIGIWIHAMGEELT